MNECVIVISMTQSFGFVSETPITIFHLTGAPGWLPENGKATDLEPALQIY